MLPKQQSYETGGVLPCLALAFILHYLGLGVKQIG